MSIIIGLRKPFGATVARDELAKMALATERYALDGTSFRAEGRIGMIFQPYHTHQRSELESQPISDVQGNMLSLDGRIDNHRELCDLLNIEEKDVPDSLIILAAFRRWSRGCFSRLIGDWAVALWSNTEQIVYLARDHAGTRTLYYQNTAAALRWSTYIETLVTGHATPFDERYVACYLAARPLGDLTPFSDIRSVPPAHYMAVRDVDISSAPHWDWIAKEKIHYHSDSDYEEHFLSIFKRSVERRTVPGAPILAQLSGGMDSTSIVCMSDHIRGNHTPDRSAIATLSFFDDSEPNWDERPYFSIIEAGRRNTGIHFPTSFTDRRFEPSRSSEGIYLLPGADARTLSVETRLEACLGEGGYRVILSGIGGDEVLGGVPTPSPELANYLLSGHVLRGMQRMLSWCLVDRTPLVFMQLATLKFTAGLYNASIADKSSIPPWISSRLRDELIERAHTNFPKHQLSGASPSAISNGLTWWSIMETLPHLFPPLIARREYRYPYLDRDLVDFLFRIPREQIVRPGRRRSLMRRALRGIVPNEILERRRKAYVARSPLIALHTEAERFQALFGDSLSARYDFIEPSSLRAAYDLILKGTDPKWCSHVLRSISLELWLNVIFPVTSKSSSVGAADMGMFYAPTTDKVPAGVVTE